MVEDDPAQVYSELEFLMDRHSQLIEEQNSTNEIIHTTFYISIVVFGAFVGIIPQPSSFLVEAILSVFAAGVFFAMFLWTRTYLNSRKEITKHMEQIVKQFKETDFGLNGIKPVDYFFSEPVDYRRDPWEQNWTKERLLLMYYLVLSAASIGIPISQFILSL